MPPLAGNLLPGDRIASSTGSVGTVIGLPSRSALRAVAVYVRWDDGREGDERISGIRPAPKSAARSPPRTSSPQARDASRPSTSQSYNRSSERERPSTAGGTPARQSGSPGHRSQADHKSTGSTASSLRRSQSSGTALSPNSRDGGNSRARSVPQREDRGTPPTSSVRHEGSSGTPPGHGPGGATAQLRGGARRRSGADEQENRNISAIPGAGNAMEILRRHSASLAAKEKTDPTPRKRNNSQWAFAERSQTVIVFDWDDTLFPTSYIIDEMKLDWRFPIAQQRLAPNQKREVFRKLGNCEAFAASLLQKAHTCGHVVVVTLAAKGWVEQACRLFYTKVGDLLRNYKIKIVNAQEKARNRQACNVLPNGKPLDPSNMEEYYGLLKGRAIAEEIDRFYSQYEGQTWKNVLSIGDSRFERYGVLAASTAYMQQRRISTLLDRPFQPAQRNAWQKVEDDKVVHLRVKVCKLVDNPDMDELAIELEMISKWLNLMVSLNEGFDLDLEALVDASLVGVVESVLRGERPATEMPMVNGA